MVHLKLSKAMSAIILVLSFSLACGLDRKVLPVASTSTPLPPTPIPSTPTEQLPPLTSILAEARQACAAAEDAPITGGFVPLPVMTLKKVVYENSDWELVVLEGAESNLIAQDAQAVKAIACIREDWMKSSYTYTDGEPGFDNEWFVWFVSWPGGEALGKIKLWGYPPEVKKVAGPGYADPPVQDFITLLQRANSSSTLFAGNENPVFSGVAFSGDGHTLAVVGSKYQTTLWNLESGKTMADFTMPISTLPGFSDWATTFSPLSDTVALSPSADKVAATNSMLNTTMVVNAPDGNLLYTLEAGMPVFSPSGDLLAVADPVKGGIVTYEIWLVDSSSGKITKKLQGGHDHSTESMAFSVDGRWLVSGGFDQKIIVWDMESYSIAHTHESSSPVESVAISPDGQLVAFAGGDGVQVWDVEMESILFSSPEYQIANPTLAISSNGKYLVFAGSEGTSFLLDLTNNQVSELLHHVMAVKKFFFSPDGSKLYIPEQNGSIMAIPVSE
ncbi:MAG TPA: WD40 repeat domain-containing protein [Anaerolineales bacterium]|nr:WD40 repeat domain-containing protein [Anaerolineales bacterium]